MKNWDVNGCIYKDIHFVSVFKYLVISVFLLVSTTSCRLDDDIVRGQLGDGVGDSKPLLTISTVKTHVNSASGLEFNLSYQNTNTVDLLESLISVTFTGTASCDPLILTGAQSTSPKVTLNNCTGDGTVVLAVAEGSSSAGAGKDQGAIGPTVTVDNQSPVTTIVESIPGVITGSSLTLTMDTGSVTDLKSYHYKWGDVGSTDCSAGTGYSSAIDAGIPINLDLSAIPTQDSRICVVGVDMAENQQTYAGATIFNFNKVSIASGTRDMTFSTTGWYGISGTGNNTRFEDILVDSAGKVLVAGIYDGSDWGDLAIDRLNQDGSPDTTFNATGSLMLDNSPWELAVGAFETSGNKIVIGGAESTADYPLVMGLNANGTPDGSFGVGGYGKKVVSGEKKSAAMAVDPVDGSYYVVGDDYGDTPFAVKFTAAGAVDNSFSGDAYYPFPTPVFAYVYDAAVDQNQKLVVVGRTRPGGGGDDWAGIIWRINPNGTLDTTFNGLGYLYLDNQYATDVDESVNGIVIDSSNNYIVTGHAWGTVKDWVVWKINSGTGALDPGFGTAGKVRVQDIITVGGYGSGTKIIFDALGNLLIVGSAYNGSNEDLVVMRMSNTGVVDTTFGASGFAVASNIVGYAGVDQGYNLAIDDSGAIYACGRSQGFDTIYDGVVVKFD